MEIGYIDIKKTVLSDNQDLAEQIRKQLKEKKVFMLNLMSSPGAGKTSLLVETIRRMKREFQIGVIEGDIESIVDSEKIAAEEVTAVQIRTGGGCHLDAAMVNEAIKTLSLDNLDLVFVENVGNLVCPAEFDIGAMRKVMILSVPEGDDKVFKYPLMFSVCDVLIINKMDSLSLFDFDMEVLCTQVQKLNPNIKIFKTSCRTGEGMNEWCMWLRNEMINQFTQ